MFLTGLQLRPICYSMSRTMYIPSTPKSVTEMSRNKHTHSQTVVFIVLV